MNEPDNTKRGAKLALSARAAMRALEKRLAKEARVPAARAQQLYYDAMDAATDDEEFALIEKALKLDPGNVDALLAALRHRPLPEADEIEVLRTIVAVAERRLGPQAFKEFEGAFWGFVETRPYMRARAQLAEALRAAGRIEEAIAEWEAVLKLNPNDNQGVRYPLLASYLVAGRMDGAARLFETYDECAWNTVFAWGRVLERWLSGDAAGATDALAVARKQNAFTEGFLKRQRRLPKYLPAMYGSGSKEEAVCFAGPLCMAWDRHPQALKWLAGQAIGRSGRDRPSRG